MFDEWYIAWALLVGITGFIIGRYNRAVAQSAREALPRKMTVPPEPILPPQEVFYKDSILLIRLTKEFDQHVRFSAPTAARHSLMALRDCATEILSNSNLFTPVTAEKPNVIPPPPEPPAGRIIKEGAQPPPPPEPKPRNECTRTTCLETCTKRRGNS